jgi:hypothetical protein
MTTAPDPACRLPANQAIPFAHLLSRLDHLEARIDVWLAKRRTVTVLPANAIADTSEYPVEPLDAGLIRTLARRVS